MKGYDVDMNIGLTVVSLIVIVALAALTIGLVSRRFRDLPLDALGGGRGLRLALVLSLLAMAGFGAWQLYGILATTARMGLRDLPIPPLPIASLAVYAAGIGLATLAFAWALATLLAWHPGARLAFDAPAPSWRRSLPAGMLMALAAAAGLYHLDRAQRLAAAGAAAMPSAELRALTGRAIAKQDYALLAALADNLTLDQETMTRIFEHCAPELEDGGQSACYATFTRLAANPMAPGAILTELAAFSVPSVRRAVGYNPATPTQVLARLAEDPDWLVRSSVLSNADLALADLEDLMRDPNDTVRRNAVATLEHRRRQGALKPASE